MKIILLLAILLTSVNVFAGAKKNEHGSVTITPPQPTHVWIINLDKVTKQTRNISVLQPVLFVMKAFARTPSFEINKQKANYL